MPSTIYNLVLQMLTEVCHESQSDTSEKPQARDKKRRQNRRQQNEKAEDGRDIQRLPEVENEMGDLQTVINAGDILQRNDSLIQLQQRLGGHLVGQDVISCSTDIPPSY